MLELLFLLIFQGTPAQFRIGQLMQFSETEKCIPLILWMHMNQEEALGSDEALRYFVEDNHRLRMTEKLYPRQVEFKQMPQEPLNKRFFRAIASSSVLTPV